MMRTRQFGLGFVILAVLTAVGGCASPDAATNPLTLSAVSPTTWPADVSTDISATLTTQKSVLSSGCRLELIYSDPENEDRTVVLTMENIASSMVATTFQFTGTYPQSSELPAGSNYRVRAFCLSESQMSNEVAVILSPRQTSLAWNPETSVTAQKVSGTDEYDFQFPANATATRDGSITYAVTSPGSAGCSLSGSRSNAVSVTSNGSCTVTATVGQTPSYLAASKSVTFTVTGVPVVQPTPTPSDEPTGGGYGCPTGSHSVTVGGRTFCELDAKP